MVTTETSERMLTIVEVAERLHCHPNTVRNLIHSNKIQSMRLGTSVQSPYRIKPGWVEDYIHSRQRRAR